MKIGIPLISIITPALDAGSTLAEALESVVSQGVPEIEHLLIDAQSSDETMEIAARYPHLTVISESDHGIYDGMNKGARLARGEWILFLQADDWLPRGALNAFHEAIVRNPTADVLCGGAEAVKRSSDGWSTVWSVTAPTLKKLTVEKIALGEPMINARLIRRDVFNSLGGFSLNYSLASDRDFLLRAAAAGVRQLELPVLTYRYRWHAGSRTMTEGNSLTSRLSKENLEIVRKHLLKPRDENHEIFKRWHSLLLVQEAMNALEKPGRQGLLTAVKEGMAVDPLWPLQFTAEIARSLPGFLARGGKTRSQLIQEGDSHER